MKKYLFVLFIFCIIELSAKDVEKDCSLGR